MHLLQVCNVGNICGGTAACAWTIARSLPQMRHSVVFLSPPTDETRQEFRFCQVDAWQTVTRRQVDGLRPDLVLLHNVSQPRARESLGVVTVQYLHSTISPARADLTVACSDWLRDRFLQGTVDRVLYQPVPEPRSNGEPDTRPLRERLIVGRLCTPMLRKWPRELIGFYERLAAECPEVDWEFVGCPPSMQTALQAACQGRATFLPAEWTARRHFWRWDALLYHHATLTESFGRTAAEAMRAGCVPIVDDRGGFREQVAPETGFLCRDADEFLSSLRQLRKATIRRRMSRAARSHATERFSLVTFAGMFLSLLNDLA